MRTKYTKDAKESKSELLGLVGGWGAFLSRIKTLRLANEPEAEETFLFGFGHELSKREKAVGGL